MYQMKKGGSSKSAKKQAAVAIAMKAAGKKPKKMAAGGQSGPGPKKTPFQSYVNKYPGSGSDTLSTPASRSRNFDDYAWMKTSSKQKADLNKAFKNTYSNYDSKAGSFRDSDGDLGGPGVRKPGLKKGGSVGKKPKMAKGGSTGFPDLTGDGKVTQADILKGRGVFKRGGSIGKSKKK